MRRRHGENRYKALAQPLREVHPARDWYQEQAKASPSSSSARWGIQTSVPTAATVGSVPGEWIVVLLSSLLLSTP